MIRARVPLLCSVAIVALGHAPAGAAAKPKALNLASCPAWGAEKKGSSTDLASLQEQADARVKSGRDASPSAKDRARLRDLAVNGKRFSEGDLVSVKGFVVGKPPPTRASSAR